MIKAGHPGIREPRLKRIPTGSGLGMQKEEAPHLSPTGWRAIEEVVGIGGHGAEVQTADLQELLLFRKRL